MFSFLIILYLSIFICMSIVFSHYNKHASLADNNNDSYWQLLLFKTTKLICLACDTILGSIDNLILNLCNVLARFVSTNINFDIAKFAKICNHDESQNDEAQIKNEIDSLCDVLSKLYIDSWHNKIKLDYAEQLNEEDFKFYCRNAIAESIYNFYRLTSIKLNSTRVALQTAKIVKSHLANQRKNDNSFDQLTAKNEVDMLTDLINDTFVQVLPQDVKSVLTNSNCHSNLQTSNHHSPSCARCSNNPVRLFLYNLIIYPLLLPLIDKVTSPLYLFYHLILFISNFGCLSVEDFIARLDIKEEIVDYKDLETVDNDPVITPDPDPEHSTNDKNFLFEAIEEPKHELKLFSNIRIKSAKISTNNEYTISNISKISPFIDYIIVFSVLECDHKKQDYANTIHLNKQSFLKRTYQVKRRFSEFLKFQHKLEKSANFRHIMNKIEKKPSNIQFQNVSLFNYLKPTKITEDSPLVEFRKTYLENFLNHLASFNSINESKEFCKFLGYQHKLLLEAKQSLHQANADRNLKSESKNIPNKMDTSFKNFKNLFKIFMPVQAKYGQLSTEIDNVVVNDQICNKYSITMIDTASNPDNNMVLKLKLDKWKSNAANLTNPEEEEDSYKKQNVRSKQLTNIDEERLYKIITDCSFLLLFKSDFTFQNYFVNKFCMILKILNIRQNIISNESNVLGTLLKAYFHYLHINLSSLNNRYGNSDDLICYEYFYNSLKDRNFCELLDQYIRFSQTQISEQLNQSNKFAHRYLIKPFFVICNPFGFVKNFMTLFGKQNSNKILFYKLLFLLINKLKK